MSGRVDRTGAETKLPFLNENENFKNHYNRYTVIVKMFGGTALTATVDLIAENAIRRSYSKTGEGKKKIKTD